jgi:hypothetical protein
LITFDGVDITLDMRSVAEDSKYLSRVLHNTQEPDIMHDVSEKPSPIDQWFFFCEVQRLSIAPRPMGSGLGGYLAKLFATTSVFSKYLPMR